MGALLGHLATASPHGFQPMNVTYGLFPPLAGRQRGRRDRRLAMAARALDDLAGWWRAVSQTVPLEEVRPPA
jgi:methylenetetrahydrofolate--tRNA-(uracil-5-)-methyltransferase